MDGPTLPTAAKAGLASVNIFASYIEALLCKKLIRSYIDVFQHLCFSYFLDGLSRH
jgi:hypothetical protein